MDSRGHIVENPTDEEIREKKLINISEEFEKIKDMNLEERQDYYNKKVASTATDGANEGSPQDRKMLKILNYLKKKQERKANGAYGKNYFSKLNKDNS